MDWFSTRWFTISQFESYDWESFDWIYGLFVIPFIFLIRWLIIYKFRQKLPIALTEKNLKNDPASVLRFLPAVFFSLALALTKKLNNGVRALISC